MEQAVIDVLDPDLRSLLDVGPGTGTFLGRLSSPPGPSLNDLVNSGNLPAAVRAHFRDVRVIDHPNAVVLPDPEPIVAYAAVSPTTTGVDRDSEFFEPFITELRRRLQDRFDADPTPWRDPKGFSVICARPAGRSSIWAADRSVPDR